MPKYAVISEGKDNSYGHPTEEVLSRLRDAEVTTFRTDMQGDISCVFDGKTVEFTVCLLFRRDLRQFGGHDAIQLQICGEVIDERKNDIAVEQQSFTFTGMGDICFKSGTVGRN